MRDYFSEFALLRVRVEVEISWLIHLAEIKKITEVPAFSADEKKFLRGLVKEFSLQDAKRIKEIETETNHDVKAVEYFIKEKICDDSMRRRL